MRWKWALVWEVDNTVSWISPGRMAFETACIMSITARRYRPEIPCTIDNAAWNNFQEYKQCLGSAVIELVLEGEISMARGARHWSSGLRAYLNN